MNLLNSISKINDTLLSVLEKINKLETQTVYITNNDDELVGVITDGDIRRGLISGLSIDDNISKFMHKKFNYLNEGNLDFSLIQRYRNKKYKSIPIISKNKKIVKIIDFNLTKSFIPVDAVIMAGGRGERLKPLTNTIPKPLIKVGGKEIISYNFDRLLFHGIFNQNITVNYLSNLIIDFCEKYDKNINFKIFKEKDFLGTAGSLSLINNFKNDNILLMNSDILSNIDYEDFYKEFTKCDADIMIASYTYTQQLPYAIFETNNKSIKSFKEKPTYIYNYNAGIYLMKKDILKFIPKNKFYNATDLLNKCLKENRKVFHYPIRGYWLDIGKHNDLEKAQKDISHINFN